MQKIPAKIQNLYLLKRLGADVPPFFIVDFEKYKEIKSIFGDIKNFFKENDVSSVIIRSASFSEDLSDSSMAGFFESSGEILIDDLDGKKIEYFWNKNKKKAESSNLGDFFIFIQEYFNADYSGVLFTEDPCDSARSIITISSSDHAITDGLSAEKKIVFDKHRKKWCDDFLNKNIKNDLEKVIKKAANDFCGGADVEFGFSGNKVRFYQTRPITRNKSEIILLNEKNRLREKFDTEFEKQVWGKNGFVEALGDLSPLSLSLYNYLLNSKELRLLLRESNVIDEILSDKFPLLENIGGRTYFNFHQEKKVFPRKNGHWNNFKRTVLFLSSEHTIKKKNLEKQNNDSTLENAFSWFFLSGIYLQFFLEQEKRKYKKNEFIERLKNTETICDAEEPRPKSLNNNDLDKFIEKYYYLSDHPYELSSARFDGLEIGKIRDKYKYFKKENSNSGKYLNKKIQFWLKSKIFWKKAFLKKLVKTKEGLEKKYGPDFFNAVNWSNVVSGEELKIVTANKEKISSNYIEISGKNYPFGLGEKKGNETIIVPGLTDIKNIKYYSDGDDPSKYFGKYIAINIFPSEWIPFIPKFKGIILGEGNELSHMAITCREYSIPCIIKPGIFSKKK